MEEINELFTNDDVADIVNDEGLAIIGQLYEFHVEALEWAVRWIHDLTGETEEDIRQIITSKVETINLDELVSKLEALQEIQESLVEEDPS